MRQLTKYIHELKQWPKFTWKSDDFILLLSEARNLQGKLHGKMETLGFDLRGEALLKTLTLDAIKTSEIEGEYLNFEQVRSSVARKLGLDIAGTVESDRDVDGCHPNLL